MCFPPTPWCRVIVRMGLRIAEGSYDRALEKPGVRRRGGYHPVRPRREANARLPRDGCSRGQSCPAYPADRCSMCCQERGHGPQHHHHRLRSRSVCGSSEAPPRIPGTGIGLLRAGPGGPGGARPPGPPAEAPRTAARLSTAPRASGVHDRKGCRDHSRGNPPKNGPFCRRRRMGRAGTKTFQKRCVLGILVFDTLFTKKQYLQNFTVVFEGSAL